MVLDLVMVGATAFGAAAFCFAAGFVVGGLRSGGAAVFPATHVSFSADLPDEARLDFLESAKDAVRLGRLGKANQLGDYPAGNKGQ